MKEPIINHKIINFNSDFLHNKTKEAYKELIEGHHFVKILFLNYNRKFFKIDYYSILNQPYNLFFQFFASKLYLKNVFNDFSKEDL